MKCPNCGKENPAIRLFCMSCGELLPEEEAAVVEEKEIEIPPVVFEQEEESETFDTADEPQEDTEFYKKRERSRRIIEEAWPETETKPKSVAVKSIFDDEATAAHTQSNSAYARPVENENRLRPVLENKNVSGHGSSKTIIPKRNEELEPDDFFAVRGQVLPEYDEEPVRTKKSSTREEYYEEEPKQSFFVRHMRSVVSMLLLLLTVGIVLIWANTDAAQRTLATLDIAWKPEAYARLGYEAYESRDLSAAGYYYAQALKRDPENGEYAYNAANAYIEGGYNGKALEALRKCIELRPADGDLYIMLLELQPDAENISEQDRELIRQGYRLTGDERLNLN